ncbi:MAG: methyltransferase [Crocinitomicaceae bacterium TMED16]|nr:O-methyltransferase [Crocinitomicaceae bacterium]OUT71522.1 MAG: methyltransferase [Crocinitomicaceae bacterium TMED16]|tara:strand:+ start:703 stop:1341 length:639 start_codon:yes stop_codon:yes gene_type:complete
MNFLDPEIEAYAEAHTTPESALLAQITRDTYLEVLQPRMLSGHLQGRVLSMLSKMIRPNSILEIGTYTGYSALCLAEGLSEQGTLLTIDKNMELYDRANAYFSESTFVSKIKMLKGDALSIVPKLEQKWDLIFIDADKENYQNYYDLTLPNLNKGGFIIADNVLWSGKVIDANENDVDTCALRSFNTSLIEDDRVEVLMLPVRDGLTVVRKK